LIPPLSDSDAHDPLAARLRAGARHAAPEPSPELRGRILAAVRAAPREAPRAPGRSRRLVALGAAALVLASLGTTWFALRARPPQATRAASVAQLTHSLLGTRARVLAVPTRAEADLRLEAERLLADGSRLARSVARGLPATLRTRDERL